MVLISQTNWLLFKLVSDVFPTLVNDVLMCLSDWLLFTIVTAVCCCMELLLP